MHAYLGPHITTHRATGMHAKNDRSETIRIRPPASRRDRHGDTRRPYEIIVKKSG